MLDISLKISVVWAMLASSNLCWLTLDWKIVAHCSWSRFFKKLMRFLHSVFWIKIWKIIQFWHLQHKFKLLKRVFFWSPLVRRHLFWPPSMQGRSLSKIHLGQIKIKAPLPFLVGDFDKKTGGITSLLVEFIFYSVFNIFSHQNREKYCKMYL